MVEGPWFFSQTFDIKVLEKIENPWKLLHKNLALEIQRKKAVYAIRRILWKSKLKRLWFLQRTICPIKKNLKNPSPWSLKRHIFLPTLTSFLTLVFCCQICLGTKFAGMWVFSKRGLVRVLLYSTTLGAVVTMPLKLQDNIWKLTPAHTLKLISVFNLLQKRWTLGLGQFFALGKI